MTCSRLSVTMLFFVASTNLWANEQTPIWPGKPPGETKELASEADTSTEDSNKVAGRSVIRLGNVSTPTIEFYPAPTEKNTGTSVVICPGGGHHILAYDLEGTEVAEWLQSIGVNGIVLKYRVPARNPKRRWEAAVQDAQRAVSYVRHHANEMKIDPDRIGILGFSAGGQTAAFTSLLQERQYEAVDEIDKTSHLPNFSVLVYTAYLFDKDTGELVPEATVTKDAPPMFFAHAFDDPVTIESSLLLYLALKRANVPSELHAYAKGGHGFGLRRTDEPCSRWPEPCEHWMRRNGWLTLENESE